MYQFGARSEANLAHPDLNPMLVECCRCAIERTPVDFGVYEGVRTLEKQREYIAAGVSWTMNSKHITGDAVDLVPYVDGAYRWEWEPIYRIGEVFRECWAELFPGDNVPPLVWGGGWTNVMSVKNSALTLVQIQKRYVQARYAANRPIRSDGAHWQIGH